MDAIKHILHEIESINYYAKEYLNGNDQVGFEDFIDYYKDYKEMLAQHVAHIGDVKNLINALPEVKSDRTFWLITASVISLVIIFMIWVYFYFFVILPIGVLVFLGIRHLLFTKRRAKVAAIISINEELHNQLTIEAQQ